MAGSTYGTLFKITTWGESHGAAIGVIIDGCPAGLPLCESYIQEYLDRRKPGQSKFTTQRKESDHVEILSGVFDGKTTGTPISLLVRNQNHISKDYDNRKAGFKLIKLDNKLQLCSRPEYFDYVRKILELKRNAPLSQAAFEVLAVVAYNQPVTKSFVEQVRGVDCSGVISTLIEKELIEERGRLELPGRPLLYGTTKNFLRCFSLTSLDDLPPLPESDKTKDDVAEQLEVRPDI